MNFKPRDDDDRRHLSSWFACPKCGLEVMAVKAILCPQCRYEKDYQARKKKRKELNEKK